MFDLGPLAHLSDSQPWAFAIMAFLGLLIGFISTVFGVGGGFFFTPFFHTVLAMNPAQAVATSMAQIPLMSLSGSLRFAKAHKIRYQEAIWLLAGSLPVAQLTAIYIGKIDSTHWGQEKLGDSLSRADLVLILFYSLVIGSLGLYSLLKDWLPTSLPQTEKKRQLKTSALLTGAFTGFISALLGVGGGFLVVPFFMCYARLQPVEAVATSLFTMLLTTALTSVNYLAQGQVFLGISLVVALGSVFGARLGARVAIGLPAASLKKYFGLLQLLVVTAYLYLKLLRA